MSLEPSILEQLNTIIEYLNFHGPLFINIPSDLESDDKKGLIFHSLADLD
ncbi:MAG: hypothetical protein ACXADY_03360 [Candidatus Hodarchaeales archaeon]